jgi:2-polyprenyl-3-methyl-5-hydroxy-6-metoxy-1,4-benzoquinol methylase
MTATAVLESSAPPQTEVVARCPVCASRAAAALFTARDKLCELPGEFSIVQCANCSLIYISERPTARAIGAYYPADYYAYKPPAAYSLFERQDARAALWYAVKKSILAHQYGYRHFGGSRLLAAIMRLPLFARVRRQATFDLSALLHPFVEEGSLLEVGCGSGMYLDLMRALGWRRVVGVDISAPAIARAKETLGLEAYSGELRDVGFDDESFDAVSLSHVLEHVAEPMAFLAELRRIVKPNGRIAIIVPNAESLAARRFGADWFHLDAPRHMVNFTRHSLGLALARAGFHVEKLLTTPRMSYVTTLFSDSRRAGARRSIYTDANHRFPMALRMRARLLTMIEHMQCAVGRPAGEELIAVARKLS